MPETLDGSGILMTERSFDLAAELLHQIISNRTLRDSVITQQKERLERYKARDLESELKQHLDPLLTR